MDHGIPSAAWEGRAVDCLFLNPTAGKGGEKNRPLNWEVGEKSGGGLAGAGTVTGELMAWQLVQFADCGHMSCLGF